MVLLNAMSEKLEDTFSALAKSNSMTSTELLARLYHYANEMAGTVVEIGAYRGASTVALAMGVRDAGRGHIHSIDPHKDFHGVLGGVFSPEDHALFESALRKHGVEEWVTHHCTESGFAVKNWTEGISLLWIDGDHSYDGVAADLQCWLPFVSDGGIVILDDHSPGSEVEAAVRDHLPFSRFIPIERIGNALVLQRTAEPRTLILCGGMQSSGSTLVSMCFLQREDMDGVYDLDNPFIQQDFSRVFTHTVWVKMTIGSFRLRELADLYLAQGWSVCPLLVYRDPEEILASLITKWYGVNGCTGDDPPLYLRLSRYLSDVHEAQAEGWGVLNYADLIREPEKELHKACSITGLDWDQRMITWPRSESEFAYPSEGNVSLRSTMESGSGLIETIERYKQKRGKNGSQFNREFSKQAKAFLNSYRDGKQTLNAADLKPCVYKGTRRETLERELQQVIGQRDSLSRQLDRLNNHVIIGRVIRLWAYFINPSVSKPVERL